MKSSLGIRSQLGAGIILTTLAGIGLIGFMSIKIVESRSVFWKINQAEKAVRLIRFAMPRFKAPEDPLRLRSFIGGAFRELGVDTFRLTDSAGHGILRQGELPKAQGAEVFYSGGVRVKRMGGGWFKGPGRALYVTAYVDEGSPAAGTIDFIVPLSDINDDMAVVRKFILFYAVLDSVIIIAFGVYFLSRSIITPIRKLEEAATRIAGGSLGERADVSVDNEIGSLAASFNTMAERLEGEIKSLERVNKELVSAQEELLRSKTLAAVGRLAAGIAHEIGNPLGALHGYLDILARGLPDRDEEKEIIGRAGKEAVRIDAIVREFLDTARPSKRPSQSVDINKLVGDAVETFSMHKDFKGLRIKAVLKEDLPPVMIDDGKLRQVFINLLANAAQSLSGRAGLTEEDSLITVETGVEKHPVPDPRRGRRRKDDMPLVPEAVSVSEREFVFISFTDRGSGISTDDTKKIFDPFFTTKESGKGTGLGLFVSQSIIKTFGGDISLKTKLGEGSTFTVTLPS